MEPAVERLHQAVLAHEPVCFYGDYDVDGMSATALYLTFLDHSAPMCGPMCRIASGKGTA